MTDNAYNYKPPCRVGDTVYTVVVKDSIADLDTYILLNKTAKGTMVVKQETVKDISYEDNVWRIKTDGKVRQIWDSTSFATREEAEAQLNKYEDELSDMHGKYQPDTPMAAAIKHKLDKALSGFTVQCDYDKDNEIYRVRVERLGVADTHYFSKLQYSHCNYDFFDWLCEYIVKSYLPFIAKDGDTDG